MNPPRLPPATTSATYAYVAGSDAPEKIEVRVGFLALADCASVVMASVLGMDRAHGVRFVLKREPSWAAVRDKLVAGELDLAQSLYGLAIGTHLGIGGPQCDMAVLMTINRNGQGITLSRALADRGAIDAPSLARLMAAEPRTYTFAQTFPTGTHAMWLYYWLAAAGIHPQRDARMITVPPPQMVAQMRLGGIDGFSVGEPWNQRAILDGVGISAANSQDIWPEHPEKVLAAGAAFVERHPNTARACVRAVLEASRWLDARPEHRRRAAEVLSAAEYVDTPLAALLPRLLGRYHDGRGRQSDDAHPLRFFDGGAVNFPYLSDAMWFMTQHRRWGLLQAHPDYLGVARRINRVALYREAAGALGIELPASELRSSRLIDGRIWDGGDPAHYADSFELQAPEPVAAVAVAAGAA